MRARKIITILLTTATLQGPLVWAESEVFVPPPTPIPKPIPKNAPQSTINIGSNVGKESQDTGSAINKAVGAALIAQGTALLPPPTTPQGAMLIAMGILALAQGAHDDKASNASLNTSNSSLYNNTPTQAKTQLPVDGSSGYTAESKKAVAALKEAGYQMTDKGLVHPDGKITPMSAFKSSGALQASGVDPSVLQKADQIASQVASGYRSSSVGTMNMPGGEGGGGGGSAHDIGPGGGGEEGSYGGANPFAMSSAAQKAMMAGKTVNLDGEPIGVSGRNLFEMVHEAYQKRKRGEQFSEDEGARSPASVKKSK